MKKYERSKNKKKKSKSASNKTANAAPASALEEKQSVTHAIVRAEKDAIRVDIEQEATHDKTSETDMTRPESFSLELNHSSSDRVEDSGSVAHEPSLSAKGNCRNMFTLTGYEYRQSTKSGTAHTVAGYIPFIGSWIVWASQ